MRTWSPRVMSAGLQEGVDPFEGHTLLQRGNCQRYPRRPHISRIPVSRFLEPKRTIDQPGLYGKLPWPIESINRFDQRVQTFEDKFSEANLADQSILLASVYVGWRISDAKAFFPKFPGGSVLEAQRKLENMLRSAKLAVVGKHNLSEVTYGWVRNSLELGTIAMSENLRADIEKNPQLEILAAARPVEFDSQGNLVDLLVPAGEVLTH